MSNGVTLGLIAINGGRPFRLSDGCFLAGWDPELGMRGERSTEIGAASGCPRGPVADSGTEPFVNKK
jgi:hypothetical protein